MRLTASQQVIWTVTGLMGFRARIAQWWGQKHGFVQRGGFIYDRQGKPIGRGWRTFYEFHRNEIWAELSADDTSSTGQETDR